MAVFKAEEILPNDGRILKAPIAKADSAGTNSTALCSFVTKRMHTTAKSPATHTPSII